MTILRTEIGATPPALARAREPAGMASLARAGALLLLAVFLGGCWPEAAAVTPPQPPKDPDVVRVSIDQMHQLTTATVEPLAFRVQKAAIGQIAFNEDASTVVLTPFSGRVTKLIAKIGEVVKRGDPLFEIDSPEVVQAQTDLIAAVHGVEKAKSQLALSKSVLDRQTGLFADKATSRRELDQARNDNATAESDFKTAEGSLRAARNRLRVIIGRDQDEVERVERERIVNPLITVNAPIDGTVIARKVGPGQYVRSDAGEALYGIADLSMMWLKANVPEADIPFIRVGQPIEVQVSALPDRKFQSRITAVGAASDASTRRVMVRSEIANPDGALKSEMFVSFKIAVGEGDPVPAIPVDALIWQGEQAVVWVEREPMLFQRRQVTAGREQDGRIEIRNGLKPGERVVARGAIFVQNEWQQ
jgi:cobalt-zinc-cadmium efflux system membrane fusion protein